MSNNFALGMLKEVGKFLRQTFDRNCKKKEEEKKKCCKPVESHKKKFKKVRFLAPLNCTMFCLFDLFISVQ